METAKVKSLHDDRAVLVCGDTESCKSCGGKAFCSVKERTYEAVIDPGLDINIGDTVQVHLPGGQTVFSAFLVMIVPLLLFMLGFWIAGRFFGVESEGLRALIGLICLGGGFLISFLYSRSRGGGDKGMPRIVDLA